MTPEDPHRDEDYPRNALRCGGCPRWCNEHQVTWFSTPWHIAEARRVNDLPALASVPLCRVCLDARFLRSNPAPSRTDSLPPLLVLRPVKMPEGVLDDWARKRGKLAVLYLLVTLFVWTLNQI